MPVDLVGIGNRMHWTQLVTAVSLNIPWIYEAYNSLQHTVQSPQ
jgi:hypothetical protein